MCFFCPVNNAKNCEGSCGQCGSRYPGYVSEGQLNGMKEEDYTP